MCQETPEKEPNPEFLQLIKRGKNYIQVVDLSEEEPSLVYEGAQDTECMLEAIAIHFGFEGVEVQEQESGIVDPLDRHKKDSLDNRESRENDEQEPEPGDQESGGAGDGEFGGNDNGEGDEEAQIIDICIPDEDHGIPEWGDDWEDDD